METSISEFAPRRRKSLNHHAAGLVYVVSLSFLLHLFTRVFSGYVYAVFLVLFTAMFIVSKRITIRLRNRFAYAWLISTIVLILSFLRSQRSNGAFLDVIIFFCGFLLILCYSDDVTIYLRCLAVIKVFAIFFAAGILLQRFLPTVYRSIIAIFPSAYRVSLSRGRSGFTLNTGYSAGYIIAGLLSCLSEFSLTSLRFRVKDSIVPICLVFSLLLTGKRGSTLFASLTFLYCYIMPVKGSNKIRRYCRVFLAVCFIAVCLLAFRDAFSSIPIIKRIMESISAFALGEDITSGRTRLYLWALELFRENPLFGIGWGKYRTTVVGNVTLVTSLETHNIYLQLLAETGIVGFVSFMIMFLIFWNKSRIAYCNCEQRENDNVHRWKRLLYFSHAYQTYFLLYGLTGNPLFDPHFQIMYIFSCMIITAYLSVEARLE